MCVAGARPNFMKIKPVIDASEARGLDTSLVHTGQHYDEAMSDVFFAELGLRAPDHHLGVGSGTHAEQTGRVMVAFEPLVRASVARRGRRRRRRELHGRVRARRRRSRVPRRPRRRRACAAATGRCPRRSTASSPTASATSCSRRQRTPSTTSGRGYRADQIHLVGNVMIDTLLANLDRGRDARRCSSALGVEPGGVRLVTLHRPANVDEPGDARAAARAARRDRRRAAAGVPGASRVPRSQLAGVPSPIDGLRVDRAARLPRLRRRSRPAPASCSPTPAACRRRRRCSAIPCLTLRENTERPITVTEGTNQLVGRDPARIARWRRGARSTERSAARRPPLWDGRAAERIVDALVRSDGGPHPSK